MTLPLFLISVIYYGPRVLALALVAVIVARLCDRLVALLRSRPFDRTEYSSVTFALLIVLMMPATVPYRVLVAAVLMAVLVAKEAFGGFESYPFHPAAVGFCMAAVSWPDYVLRYPPQSVWFANVPDGFDQFLSIWRFENVTIAEGPSFALKSGAQPSVGLLDLFLGNYNGPAGVTCTLVILACAAFLLVRRRINFTTPACFLGSALGVAILEAFLFPRYPLVPREGESMLLLRAELVGYEMLSGAIIFAAVFLACDPGTQPKQRMSRAVYGILLGVGTMMFRYFGLYEIGACFAILLINALSGFIDRIGREKTEAPAKEVVQQ